MRSFAIIVAVLAVAFTVSVPIGRVAGAQEGTPGSGDATFPITPGPEECTVEPLSEGDFMTRIDALALPSTAEARTGIDVEAAADTPGEFLIPDGEPVAEATVAEITATTQELIACSNAGNQLSFFALTTDNLFRQLLGDGPVPDETVAAMQEVVDLPEEAYTSLLGVTEARELADGRVGALVESGVLGEESTIDFIIFVEQDGRFLVDDVIQDLGGQ